MKMADVRKKARATGVEAGKLGKKELILAIQAAEGNEQCFGSGRRDCAQAGCCWRGDCLPEDKRAV